MGSMKKCQCGTAEGVSGRDGKNRLSAKDLWFRRWIRKTNSRETLRISTSATRRASECMGITSCRAGAQIAAPLYGGSFRSARQFLFHAREFMSRQITWVAAEI